MSDPKQKLFGSFFLAIIASTLMSCGGGGGSGDDDDDNGVVTPPLTTTTYSIGATFVKGLVTDADCELFEIDTAGAKSDSIATGTSANGSVDFGSDIEYEGMAIIECEGGVYTDEALGVSLAAPLTRAVVNIEGDASFTVSPLTEIATQLAEAGGDLSTALTTYNQQVADSFGFDDDVDITLTVPTDLETTVSSDDDAGDYATILALLSQLDGNSANSIEELVDQLSADLSDGSFSDATLNEMGFAAQDILDSAVSSNLSSASLSKVVTEANISESPVRDVDAPSGYSISISNDFIGSENEDALEINVFNAEIGASYFYEITSLEGSSSVTGDGIVLSSTNFSISDINISGIADGEITASLYLVDFSENQGIEVTDMVTKDAQAPEGYGVSGLPSLIGSDNQIDISFSVSGAEPGGTYQYTFYVIGDTDELVVEADGTIESEEFTVSGINLSSLADGVVVLELTILDSAGNSGQTISVRANKNTLAAAADLVVLSGRVTFDRVAHDDETNGLNFNSVTREPARAVTVEAVSLSDELVATTTTDANGEYQFVLSQNIQTYIRVKAEMYNTSGASWDVRVTDNTSLLSNNPSLYALEGSPSYPSEGSTRDLHAASGWDSQLEEYGDSESRAAAPFAILDVIYESMQKFIAVDNDIDFPPLDIRWSTANNNRFNGDEKRGEIGTSFYDPDSNAVDTIYLLGDATLDTDEYDSHVIAHEWTHYFMNNFSRWDSIGFNSNINFNTGIGATHSLSDRLDFRVAFSEGLANAVSGMILDDSVYRDSFSTDHQGLAEGVSFDLEDNSYTNAEPGWFSEASVQSILYDLYDGADDESDSIELGLGFIYEVLVDEDYQESPYFASIYLFIDELLEQQSGSASEINALLAAQDIDGTGPDGAGEINNGSVDGDLDAEGYSNIEDYVLPVYKTLTVDDLNGVELCSSSEAGFTNKLGVHSWAFVSLPAPSSSYQIELIRIPTEAESSNGYADDIDPDVLIYSKGIAIERLASGEDNIESTNDDEPVELDGGDYVFDIYDAGVAGGITDSIRSTCFQLTIQEEE